MRPTLKLKYKMYKSEYVLEKLGEHGIIILMYLYNKKDKRAFIREIKDKFKMGSTTVYRTLTYLIFFGLVKEVYSERRKYLVLTEKGERVAKKIAEIEKILAEGIDISLLTEV